jgi:MFS family permease
MAAPRGLRWRYYAYQVSHSNGFYLPLSILYLQKVRGFGYTDIGLILGGFSIAMVAAEIPTGYLGDRLGRRATLALSNLVGAGFMLGYVVVETPLGYLSLYGVWAVGWAFRSGTRDAWLYELLNRTDDEDTFATVSGRATAVELGIEAVSALAVGALATFSWGLPFLANAGVAALGLPLLLTLPETHGLQDDSTSSADASDEEELPVDTPGQADTGLTIHAALRALRIQIGQKEIRWFIVYAALFHGLFSVTRTFEQPALDRVGVSVAGLGVLYAAFKLVSASAASLAGPLRSTFGTKRVFALLAPVYGIAWATIAFRPVLVLPLLFLNRGLFRVLTPLRNHYLNEKLGDVGRATVLSGASMILSVAAGLAKITAGILAARIGLLQFLAIAGVTVAVAGGVLWMTVSPVDDVSSHANTVTGHC